MLIVLRVLTGFVVAYVWLIMGNHVGKLTEAIRLDGLEKPFNQYNGVYAYAGVYQTVKEPLFSEGTHFYRHPCGSCLYQSPATLIWQVVESEKQIRINDAILRTKKKVFR